MADINFGAITEALNNKVDLVMGVPQDAVDYVVAMQRPTADNNYTWYRKYKSGWVEQGGQVQNSNQSTFDTVALPVEMSDANYMVNLTSGVSGNAFVLRATNRTVISFVIACDKFSNTDPVGAKLWSVCGMAA